MQSELNLTKEYEIVRKSIKSIKYLGKFPLLYIKKVPKKHQLCF